jgi:hypothetical protein
VLSRTKFPKICADPKISSGCPVACGTATSCYKGKSEDAASKKYTVFNRIMLVETKSSHRSGAVLYVPDNYDPERACREIGHAKTWWDDDWKRFSQVAEGNDVNISDCDEVQKVLSSYSMPISNWNDKVHADLVKSGGYTVSFWMRINDVSHNADAHPRDKFRIWVYSSLYPMRPLFALFVSSATSVELRVWTTCGVSENVPLTMPQGFEYDRWYFVSISYGVEREGLKRMQLMIDSVSVDDSLNFPWCTPNWSQSPKFIEAIQATKGTMFSPFDITTTGPVSLNHLQALYYSQLKKIQLRMGPSASDEDREDEPIEYDRRIFSSPLALIAPPILLQERKTPSSHCNNVLGTAYVADLW